MRWVGALVLLGIAATARGDALVISQADILALTSIDQTASTNDFVLAFDGSGSAVANLAAIGSDASADVGVQLRAIRGLAQFPDAGSVPHDTLIAIIHANADAPSGSSVLILRAAIESLGALAAGGGQAQPSDTTLLVSHLDDSSRDVRATTALALGQLCDTSAVTPLEVRFQAESAAGCCEQVKLAISDALRALAACSPS